MGRYVSWAKISLALFVSCFAIFFAAPNFTSKDYKFLPSSKVNLGLDLRGGSHLLLEVGFDDFLDSKLSTTLESVRRIFRKNKIGYRNLQVRGGGLHFQLRDSSRLPEVRRLIGKFDKTLEVNQQGAGLRIFYSENSQAQMRSDLVAQSIEIVRMRVDSTGTTEPLLQRQGENNILLQVPGQQDPAQLKRVLGKTARLTFHLLDDSQLSASDVTDDYKTPEGKTLAYHKEDTAKLSPVLIEKKPILGGENLIKAETSFNQENNPVLAFEFDKAGAREFAEVTKNNVGRRLGILLDDLLLSSPYINGPITGGSGIITGNFTIASVSELALMLRAGALPAPLSIVEERSIGPTLGQDSIEAGKKAGMIGFAAVVILMILVYGTLGVFAVLALILAMIYILSLLSVIGASLTLPGIAGIILTIGMAVDANVLIYERIREEIKKGASLLYSIQVGFDSAFATITDSNVTTLIAALMLYIFGVGAIKGFAVTLTIGIVSSMFASIVVTKLLLDLWMRFVRPKSIGLA